MANLLTIIDVLMRENKSAQAISATLDCGGAFYRRLVKHIARVVRYNYNILIPWKRAEQLRKVIDKAPTLVFMNILAKIVEYDQVELIDILPPEELPVDTHRYPNICMTSVMLGSLRCLIAGRERGFQFGNACYLAIKYGKLDCLKYIHEHGEVIDWHDILIITRKHLKCIQKKYNGATKYTCNCVKVLKYIESHQPH